MKSDEKPSRPYSAALLAAAGAGERLGRGPKAFLPLAGLSLIERSVAALAVLVDELVVAVPRARLVEAADVVAGVQVIAGGETRQETVFRLLAATEARLVVVHDVARPFLPTAVLERVLEAAESRGAATAVVPVADTLIEAENGRPLDRSRLRAVQTPQAFRRELLLHAHEQAARLGLAATDDASLVRAAGAEVELVEGSPWLFKLTSEADFWLAEAVAEYWDRVQAPSSVS